MASQGAMTRGVVVLVALANVWTTAAGAQRIASSPEFRADVLGPGPYSLQLGTGVNLGAGYYQRLELDLGAGAVRRDHALVGAGRVDALMRVLLDPFGRERWGLSLAGGVSARYEAGDRVRPYLVGALDFEGPLTHGTRVAYQLGLGGGIRVGVVLRRSDSLWR
ncbi:MAG: hypothetical protein B7Z72_11165 [Gemmatimonadetes bacterium 21-71-4]|nr:MAG: hypothetical protein B7Z72_11165 [Gemmatimonadetes bacterium 21-71-4]